jgi:hypothetical protein
MPTRICTGVFLDSWETRRLTYPRDNISRSIPVRAAEAAICNAVQPAYDV